MGKISFENFGIAASKGNDNTISASRYYMQKDEEKLILGDVISKLEITSEDELMDVGSNTGNLTIPLSFFVNNITAVDHAECLEKLNSRFPNLDNICLIPGDFMEVDIKKTFNKILIYSVLHYLEDENETIDFIVKAASLLKAGGRLLLGDLPNIDKERRFLNSDFGKKYQEEWISKRKLIQKKLAGDAECIGDLLKDSVKDARYVQFNDALILKIIGIFRNKGYHVYLFPQAQGLPFSNEREDIVIEKLLD